MSILKKLFRGRQKTMYSIKELETHLRDNDLIAVEAQLMNHNASADENAFVVGLLGTGYIAHAIGLAAQNRTYVMPTLHEAVKLTCNILWPEANPESVFTHIGLIEAAARYVAQFHSSHTQETLHNIAETYNTHNGTAAESPLLRIYTAHRYQESFDDSTREQSFLCFVDSLHHYLNDEIVKAEQPPGKSINTLGYDIFVNRILSNDVPQSEMELLKAAQKIGVA